jgi:anti-sigma-K factor RskA
MDYKEFEEHVADYVEGLCDERLRRRMEEKRREDPACDQLARMHENILAALQDTPEVKAPAGLSERILAAVEAEESQIAAESKSFREYVLSSLPIAACAVAALTGLFYTLKDNLYAAAQFGLGWSQALSNWFNSESEELAVQADKGISASNQALAGWLTFVGESSEKTSTAALGWLQTVGSLLNYPVELPFFTFTLPVVYLFTGAVLGATLLWFYRDSLFSSGYSPALYNQG